MKIAALILSTILLLSSCSTSTEIGNTTFCNCNSEQEANKYDHPFKLVDEVKEKIHGNPLQNIYYNTENGYTFIISYLYTNTNGEPILTRTTITVYDENGKIIKQNDE